MKTSQNFATTNSRRGRDVWKRIGFYAVCLAIGIGMVWSCGDSDGGGSPDGGSDDGGSVVTPSITISPSSVTLNIRESNDFIVTLNNFSNEEDKVITFDNGNTNIISLIYYSNEESYLNGNRTNFRVAVSSNIGGTATITARSGNGATAQIEVTVNQPVTRVILSPSSLNMKVGETAIITFEIFPPNAKNTNLFWTTGNSIPVTVDNGLVTAVARGTTYVAATNISGAGGITTIDVKDSDALLLLREVTILVGETKAITTDLLNPDNTNLTWTSSSDAIATVTDGVITGVSPGRVAITASSGDGEHSTTMVTVIQRQ